MYFDLTESSYALHATAKKKQAFIREQGSINAHSFSAGWLTSAVPMFSATSHIGPLRSRQVQY